jgi:hypothetical protein
MTVKPISDFALVTVPKPGACDNVKLHRDAESLQGTFLGSAFKGRRVAVKVYQFPNTEKAKAFVNKGYGGVIGAQGVEGIDLPKSRLS